MNYYLPTKLFTGKDVLSQHIDEFKLGNKCLIVTGKHSAKLSGALDDVCTILNNLNIEYHIYDEIGQNPLMYKCLEAGKMARGVDFIIGIGGGSVLDASKVISVVGTNPGISKEEVYNLKWQNKNLPLILIGTTAGTGSEVTKVAVISDEESGRKKSGHHNDYYAKVAFGDPKYTLSLNKEFTVSTGIDALAHLVESYFSNKADEISRAYSLKGINDILPILKLLNNNIDLNYQQRETLYNCSILGGLAINTTGTTFAHNVGYYLTENYHLPHGIACAIFMEDLLVFEKKQNNDYYKEFFYNLHFNEEEFIVIVNNLLPNIDIKMSLTEIDSIMPRYENNNSVKNTKGKMSSNDIKEILIKKFVK